MDIYEIINRPSANFSNKNTSNMGEIIYKPICPEKTNEVIEHLRHNFFQDEPLNKSIDLAKRGEPHAELERYCLNSIKLGASFMGIVSTTGQVVGVSINGFESEESDSHKEKTFTDPKLRKIFDFLGEVEKGVNILNEYHPRSIFEMRILSVDNSFRGQGIGKSLCEIAVKAGASGGFSIIRADATAFFSQKLLEKVGFYTVKEVRYAEYPSKEAPLFNVEPPNVSFKLMVKKLGNRIL